MSIVLKSGNYLKNFPKIPNQIVPNNIDEITSLPRKEIFNISKFGKEYETIESFLNNNKFNDEISNKYILTLMNKNSTQNTDSNGSVIYKSYRDFPDLKIFSSNLSHKDIDETHDLWANPALIQFDIDNDVDSLKLIDLLFFVDRKPNQYENDNIPLVDIENIENNTSEISIHEFNKKATTLEKEISNKVSFLNLGKSLYDNSYCTRVYLSAINSEAKKIEKLPNNSGRYFLSADNLKFNILKIEECNSDNLSANLIFNSIRIPMKVLMTSSVKVGDDRKYSYVIEYPEYLLNQENIVDDRENLNQIEGIEFVSDNESLTGNIYINSKNSYKVNHVNGLEYMNTVEEYSNTDLSNSHMIYTTNAYSEFYKN